MGQRFRGIQRFTTADPQHGGALRAAGDIAQAIDFIMRTLTAKRRNFGRQASVGQAFTQHLFRKPQYELIADYQPAFGQRLQIVAEALDGACALNVFAW